MKASKVYNLSMSSTDDLNSQLDWTEYLAPGVVDVLLNQTQLFFTATNLCSPSPAFLGGMGPLPPTAWIQRDLSSAEHSKVRNYKINHFNSSCNCQVRSIRGSKFFLEFQFEKAAAPPKSTTLSNFGDFVGP